jgi:diaminopimelate epimerase
MSGFILGLSDNLDRLSSMQKAFLKMHGLGNDFVIIDGRTDDFIADQNLLLAIANRRRGIGCDQVIILQQPKSSEADVYLDMYNADASSLRACGNATRCVAQLLFEELARDHATIQTVAGLLKVSQTDDGMTTVDMDAARLSWEEIPLAHAVDTLHVPLAIGTLSDACCVNIGNPHAVFFVPDIDSIPLAEWGSKLEMSPLFPDRANIEIAQLLAPDRIRMRVWERGSGITQACGSAACATIVAAVRRGLMSIRRATIVMDGGEATLEWGTNNHVYLTGPTAKVYRGVLDDEFFACLSQRVVS